MLDDPREHETHHTAVKAKDGFGTACAKGSSKTIQSIDSNKYRPRLEWSRLTRRSLFCGCVQFCGCVPFRVLAVSSQQFAVRS
jgi:hypothetical protein